MKSSGFKLWSLGFRPYRALRLKSKILLGHIAEGYHNGSGYYFCNCGIYVELFDKKAYKNIIQDNTYQDKQEIPEKLHSSVQNRPGKNDMTHQHKAGWETDEKGYYECSYIRFERYEAQV